LSDQLAPPECLTARHVFRVLMIASTSFFADYGCHVRILEEARILQQLGNDVTICTYHNGRDIDTLDIRRTIPIPWRTRYEVGSSRHKLAFDLLLGATVLRTALAIRPNVIHGHTHEAALLGYPASRVLRIPLVLDFQGSMTAEMVDHRFLNPSGPLYSPARRLEERIVQLSHAIITSSLHAERVLVDEFGCAAGKITAIPDCVNAASFAPRSGESRSELLTMLGIPPQRHVIVYLGLLAEWQGTGLLLAAAQELLRRRTDVHFLIMGFPSVEAYRLRAQELGISEHTTFTGKVPYEQAPDYLALGEIAVSPKVSETEGSGKLLNYMAMGLPTVAFETPVSREYLGDLGVYASRRDAVSLARALEDLISAPARARALGLALRQRAEALYSWTQAGRKIMRVYETYAC